MSSGASGVFQGPLGHGPPDQKKNQFWPYEKIGKHTLSIWNSIPLPIFPIFGSFKQNLKTFFCCILSDLNLPGLWFIYRSSSSSSYSFNVRDPKTHTVFQASALARVGPPVIFLQAQRSCAISSFIPIAFMSLLTQLLHVFLGAPLSTRGQSLWSHESMKIDSFIYLWD